MVLWLLLLALFGCLVLLTQWITRHAQGIGYLLTGDGRIALTLYFVLILPGVVLHEASHVLVAWILRVPIRHLELGIRRKAGGEQVALGSVHIADTDPVRSSLIGLAPLLAGIGAILLISDLVLDLRSLIVPGTQGFWQALLSTLQTPDFAVWAYLVFATGNAMLPSTADRRSWVSALILAAFIGALAFFSGLLKAVATPLGQWLRVAASQLIYACAVTVAVDLVMAAGVFAAEQALGLLGFGRLEYRRHP
jgi:hypothetical protein